MLRSARADELELENVGRITQASPVQKGSDVTTESWSTGPSRRAVRAAHQGHADRQLHTVDPEMGRGLHVHTAT